MKKNQSNLTAAVGPNLAQRVYSVSRVWVILVLALVFPFLGANNYLLHMANVSMMFAILTISLNVLSGFTGLMSVGHIAFFGIGAYTTAILTTTYGMPIWLGFIAAGVVSALFSLLFGAVYEAAGSRSVFWICFACAAAALLFALLSRRLDPEEVPA